MTLLAASFPHGTTASELLLSRDATIRIMPLGDSITAGVAAGGARVTDGGYRGALAQLLARYGYHAVFVGTRNDYSAAIPARAHEGWPGYVLRSYPSNPGPGQLYGALVRKAMRSNGPDVVLLMAGTNDLIRLQHGNAGYTLTNIVSSMNLVLDEIFYERPNVRVIVAPVVSSPVIDFCTLAHFDGDDLCGPTLGPNLKTLVDEYAQRGFRISLASGMERAVPRDARHFPDGIHPSGDSGYTDIAGVWLGAIERVTAPPSASKVATK